MVDDVDYRRISIFLVAAYVPAYLMDLMIYFIGSEKALMNPFYRSLLVGRMYFPMLGVILSLFITKAEIKDGLKKYGLRIGKRFPQLLLLGISVPYLIYVVGVAYGYLIGFPITNPVENIYSTLPEEVKRFLDPLTLLAITLVSTLISGISLNTLFAIGEEIGWRGLMLDELGKRFSLPIISIIIGLIWSLWHAPLIILFGYNYPTNRLLGMLLYTLICIIWTYILSILKLLGGSIIPAAAMHGTINAVVALMTFTIPIQRTLGMPVGLLSIISSLTILIPMIFLKRAIHSSRFE
ncbi:MAG TPA: CPBP family intramembrane metalloprotease [Nitrososphaeria archaeon]|nr:CPBP family intramembrane metalloprotease [Nitrososphaeria archaeon]